jgi:hypothetical protein
MFYWIDIDSYIVPHEAYFFKVVNIFKVFKIKCWVVSHLRNVSRWNQTVTRRRIRDCYRKDLLGVATVRWGR